jgi:minimal PKS ketosynthase (KS/KS alpha)
MLVAGRTATRRITHFDPALFRSQMAAECDFDPHASGLTPQEIERFDRNTQLAAVAAAEAVEDSRLDMATVNRERVGVSMGSAIGGTTRLEQGYVAASQRGEKWVVDADAAPPFVFQSWVPSSLAAEIALKFRAQGPAFLVSTGCTAGIDSIGYAQELIQDNEADVVIAGASESGISPITIACFDPIKATSRRNDDPEHASRPFDSGRDGFVLGEGAAVLILEEIGHARARGARIYCEIVGYSARSTAYHMTALRPGGSEMSEAISDAMWQANVRALDIDYISAHGSGTKQNDRHETGAYKIALGEAAYRIPISSIKSMVGHSLGAIGSIEMAACALVIQRGIIPPTANLENPEPQCDLDYVPRVARERRVDVALSVGSGFGGFQSAMIFARVADGDG